MTDKGEGYCFDCEARFEIEMLSHPCPECGSDRWAQDPNERYK